jgi:hypothetical protein
VRRLARFLLGVLLGTALVVSGPLAKGEEKAAPRQRGAAAEKETRRLDEIRSLGYAEWDTGADPNLRGVTLLDRARAAPGYNLFTNNVDEVILLDLEGKRVRTWKLPEGDEPCEGTGPHPICPGSRRDCEHAELLSSGEMVVVCIDGSLHRLGWNGNAIMTLKIPVHHDVAVLPDGSMLLPHRSNRLHEGMYLYFDSIVTLSREGKRLGEWSTFEHLEELRKYHEPPDLSVPTLGGDQGPGTKRRRHDYYHLNTIEVLPDTPLGRNDSRFRAGNWLVCLRNANLILVLDADDQEVLWHWGSDLLDLPHMPTMLENGNILIFDNGQHRGHSRVLEIQPPDGTIVWSYEADPKKKFFTKSRGSSQRLGNGNTLIGEGNRGHAFEVTPGGEIVWEFWNPEVKRNKRRPFYRFMRYPPSMVEPLLRGKTSSELSD